MPAELCYYVTARDGRRAGFLLGPYPTHAEAQANVGRGRDLAEQADPWAASYAFGTASLPAGLKQPETVFGV